jgi:hypothetical protein
VDNNKEGNRKHDAMRLMFSFFFPSKTMNLNIEDYGTVNKLQDYISLLIQVMNFN